MSFIGDLNIEISRLRSDLAVMTKLRDNAEADLRLQEQAHSSQQRATIRALEDLAAARRTLAKIAYYARNRNITRIALRDAIESALAATKEDKP